MRLFDEDKIDCHAHVYDPANFPYQKDTPYRPAGQEIGTAAQYRAVMKTYGVKYSLLVQPNSGYAGDNSCMLDAIARGNGALKGVAIASFDASLDDLRELKSQGIVGIAFNPTFYGSSDSYKPAEPLIKRLVELDMFLQIQSENDQLLLFVPWIEAIPIKVLIDHCGRPAADEGLKQTRFPGALAPRPHRPRQREDFRLPEILASVLSVRGLLTLRAGDRRGVHARPLHVGVGLAFSARGRTPGLRAAHRTCRHSLSRSGRAAKAVLGYAAPSVRLRPVNDRLPPITAPERKRRHVLATPAACGLLLYWSMTPSSRAMFCSRRSVVRRRK